MDSFQMWDRMMARLERQAVLLDMLGRSVKGLLTKGGEGVHVEGAEQALREARLDEARRSSMEDSFGWDAPGRKDGSHTVPFVRPVSGEEWTARPRVVRSPGHVEVRADERSWSVAGRLAELSEEVEQLREIKASLEGQVKRLKQELLDDGERHHVEKEELEAVVETLEERREKERDTHLKEWEQQEQTLQELRAGQERHGEEVGQMARQVAQLQKAKLDADEEVEVALRAGQRLNGEIDRLAQVQRDIHGALGGDADVATMDVARDRMRALEGLRQYFDRMRRMATQVHEPVCEQLELDGQTGAPRGTDDEEPGHLMGELRAANHTIETMCGVEEGLRGEIEQLKSDLEAQDKELDELRGRQEARSGGRDALAQAIRDAIADQEADVVGAVGRLWSHREGLLEYFRQTRVGYPAIHANVCGSLGIHQEHGHRMSGREVGE